MRESASVYEKFCNCMDQAADAERAKNWEGMWYWTAEAGKLPCVVPWQSWMYRCADTVFHLLYDDNYRETRFQMSVRLVELRKEALRNPQDILFMVKGVGLYQNLLMHFLQKNFEWMDRFQEYEEMALEFKALVDDGECEKIDYYGKKIFAYAVLGQYYLSVGSVQLSRQYYDTVWEMALDIETIDAFIFRNLANSLFCYYNSGDIHKTGEYADCLMHMVVESRIPNRGSEWEEVLFRTAMHKIISIIVIIYQIEGESTRAEAYARELTKRRWHVSEEIQSDGMLLVYSTYLNILKHQKKKCGSFMFLKMERFFRLYYRMELFDDFPAWLRCNYYWFGYLLYRERNRKRESECLDRAEDILSGEIFPEADRMAYLNLMVGLLEVRLERGENELAQRCVDRLFRQLLQYYKVTEYYSDNERMEQYLGICRLSFQLAYQKIWTITDTERRLEYSMNFKNVLSSAIRYRNTLLSSEKRGTKRIEELRYISLDELIDRIPERTALLDFIYLDPRIQETETLFKERGETYRVEIFAAIRDMDEVRLRQFEIADDRLLQKRLEELLDRLRERDRKTDEPARKLYELLLEPLSEDLRDSSHLWICADGELWNLPFETVIEQGGDWICEDLVYWQSLRDLFERWDEEAVTFGSMCAIGDPQFKRNERQPKSKEQNQKVSEREASGDLSDLPYSGYEVRKAVQIMGGVQYTGEKAGKSRVQSGFRYLHIATHGIVLEGDGAEWERSALAFSYGDENGILTAGEISRMQMGGTKLAVLSACRSGNSLFSEFRHQIGLHIAFGVAGVQYSISALWRVDDLVSALLMSFFYTKLSQGSSIPKALRIAKESLREMTVEELCDILRRDRQLLGDGESEKLIRQISDLPDGYRLFSSPYYWAGYICYCFRSRPAYQYCRYN